MNSRSCDAPLRTAAACASNSAADMERKQNLLRRWLSYAVALHQPGLPSRLLKMTEIRLYGGHDVVGAAGTAERHAAVAEFLHWWRTASRR